MDDRTGTQPAAGRHSRTAPRLVGAVVVLAGLAALLRTVSWFVLDSVGGAELNERSAALLAMLVAAAVLVGGVVLLLTAARLADAGRTGLVVVGGVLAVGAGWLAVEAFPSIERGAVVALDPADGHVLWRQEVPLVRVAGVLEATPERLTIEGSWTDHGCGSEHRSVTLDRSTGELLETTELPSSYPSIDDVPTTEPLAAHDLVAEEGSLPFVCLN